MHRKYIPFLLFLTTTAMLIAFLFIPYEIIIIDIKIKKPDIYSQVASFFSPQNTLEADSSFSKDTLKTEHLLIDSLIVLTHKINLDSILEQEKNDLRISTYTKDNVLFPVFFNALKNVKGASKVTRIAYFGDSMIEGDLISQTLRTDLQNKMGGKGVGFVPITSIVSQFRRSIKHEFSNDWKEYSIQKSKEKKNFAPAGFVYNPRILTTEQLKDSSGNHPVSFVKYTAPQDAVKTLNHLYSTKLYYGKAPSGSYIKYKIDNKIFTSSLKGKDVVNEFVLNDSKAYKELYIEFYTDSVFDIYGCSFESSKGVFIDNYAVRGNLGMALQKIPANVLMGFNKYMNYSLLIFQFGLNVASPEARAFGWYENAMVDVLKYYKSLMPDADILVISIGDKSAKYNMEFVTQPGIPKLVEAQRNIAKRTESHFWNLYQSMGGYNAMKSWVEREYPLASKDYAHINFRGAEKISRLLSDNIFNEFELFELNELKEKEKKQLFESLLKSNSWLVDNFISFDKHASLLVQKDTYKIKEIDTTELNKQIAHNVVEKDTLQELEIEKEIQIEKYEFRVQLAASKNDIDIKLYDSLLFKAPGKKLRKIKHKDNYYRIYITPYNVFESANECALRLIADGHDAFVVGFINDDRAPVDKVKTKILDFQKNKEQLAINYNNYSVKTNDSDEQNKMTFIQLNKFQKPVRVLTFVDIYNTHIFLKDTMPNYVVNLNKETHVKAEEKDVVLPVFRVQFCASLVDLDVSFYQNIIDFFGDTMIIISRDEDGMIRYMLGDFDAYEKAEKVLNDVFALNQDGYITAYYYEKRIKTEKAVSIINNLKNKR